MMKKILSYILCFFFLDGAAVFRCVHAQEEGGVLRDVKSPVGLPFNFFMLFIALFILALILTAGLVIFLLKKNRTAEVKPVAIDPPWVIAYRKIEQLKSDNLIAQGQVKPFFTRLSDIVRHYLEGRFGIRAPEMTTEEFLWELRRQSPLNERQKGFLKEFLNSCDMVKFARHPATAEEMEHVMTAAHKLVDETKDTGEILSNGQT